MTELFLQSPEILLLPIIFNGVAVTQCMHRLLIFVQPERFQVLFDQLLDGLRCPWPLLSAENVIVRA